MEGQHRKVWDGLHVSSRLAPSKGAKLCTYFARFFRPSQLRFEPYLDIPMSISRLLLMQIRMGSHSLPVEQGRLARPMIPRQLRRCTLCSTHAIGRERHYVFDCPHFAHIRRQFRSLLQDADGAMQSVHKALKPSSRPRQQDNIVGVHESRHPSVRAQLQLRMQQAAIQMAMQAIKGDAEQGMAELTALPHWGAVPHSAGPGKGQLRPPPSWRGCRWHTGT